MKILLHGVSGWKFLQNTKIVPTFRQIYLSSSEEVKRMQIAVVLKLIGLSSVEIYIALFSWRFDIHFFVSLYIFIINDI